MWIRNTQQILNNAQTPVLREIRQTGLEILENMVSQLQPNILLAKKLRRINNELRIAQSTIRLSEFDEFLVVGGGKSVAGMITTLEALLPDRTLRGIVSIPDGLDPKLLPSTDIILQKAAHPIPDKRGLKATKEMASLLKRATEGTLVFFLISGGGSALMPLPANGISLKTKIEVNRLLLESGATINEANMVRKHLSAWKGGQAAQLACPATLVSLILSDVIGDPLDVIASGPTVPDTSTFSDAHKVLIGHHLWEHVDSTVKNHIQQGLENNISETPKLGESIFQKAIVEVIGNNRTATDIIMKMGQEMGYNMLLLTNNLQGEAREIGRLIGAIGLQLERIDEPIPKPCIVLIGGETTVTVVGKGSGGRNQELALGCSKVISGSGATCVIAFGTDGIDGASDAAGAIVDGMTHQRLSKKGIDIEDILRQNNSATAFKKIGDEIITGYTGTNVADVVLVISQA